MFLVDMHFYLLPWVRPGYIPYKMASKHVLYTSIGGTTQEEPRARKDMVLEGNRSGRGLVTEITKMVPDAICQLQKMHLGWFRV